MTKKAYIDTTVLTDILLKRHGKGRDSVAALRRYDFTLLPMYAIKEFKKGPLRYFRWMHNTFATTNSFGQSLKLLGNLFASMQRYMPRTALESLSEAGIAMQKLNISTGDLVKKYGEKASLDRTLSDYFRASIRSTMARAWERRKQAFSEVVGDLSCYSEAAPFFNSRKSHLIEITPYNCNVTDECCLGPSLRKKLDEVRKLEAILDDKSNKRERKAGYKIMHELSRKPRQKFTQDACNGLGDCYFAIFCPQNAVVLTTNSSDHTLLTEALGKRAETP